MLYKSLYVYFSLFDSNEYTKYILSVSLSKKLIFLWMGDYENIYYW